MINSAAKNLMDPCLENQKPFDHGQSLGLVYAGFGLGKLGLETELGTYPFSISIPF